MIGNGTFARICCTGASVAPTSLRTFGGWRGVTWTTCACGLTISPPNAVPTTTIASGLAACCARVASSGGSAATSVFGPIASFNWLAASFACACTGSK